MKQSPIDQEIPEQKNLRNIRVAADLLMILSTIFILFQLAEYPFLQRSIDSNMYIPKYTTDYTYRYEVFKIIVLAAGILLGQVFRIMYKPYPALISVSLGILLFMLAPYLIEVMEL